MDKVRRGRIFSIASGTCFIALTLYGLIIRIIKSVTEKISFFSTMEVSEVVQALVLVAIAVALYTQRTRVVAAGFYVYSLFSVSSMLFFFSFGSAVTAKFSLQPIFSTLSYLSAVVIIALTLVENKVAPKLWFTSGILFLASAVAKWFLYFYFENLTSTWHIIAIDVVGTAGMLLMGLWVKNSVLPKRVRVPKAQNEIRGVVERNKISLILSISGLSLLYLAFVAGLYEYRKPFLSVVFNFYEFFFKFFFKYLYGYIFILAVIVCVAALIVRKLTDGCEISVTPENVFGRTANGSRVNIPLDQISGMRYISFNGIAIDTNGFTRTFYCVKNRAELLNALAGYMGGTVWRPELRPAGGTSYPASVPVQNEYVRPAAVEQQMNAGPAADSFSTIEQLKKCKKLLDAGAISQEEFEAMKKQILGM